MQTLIGTLLRELLKKLDAELVKEIVDGVLDKLENKIAETPNKWDDVTVQPIIDTIRRVAGIEDEEYGDDKKSAEE